LTFLAVKQYPSYSDINDVLRYVGEINEIVKIRYIDINDRLIVSVIHVMETDSELQTTCRNINKEINDIVERARSQVFGGWS
jgi:hypothetical protein